MYAVSNLYWSPAKAGLQDESPVSKAKQPELANYVVYAPSRLIKSLGKTVRFLQADIAL